MAKNTKADYSTTAASNTDALGQSTAGTAAANTIDTLFQNLMAVDAREYGDKGGLGTVGGSANAITLTSLSTYQSNANGVRVAFKAASTNTGATTFNLDGNGIKAVRLQGDVALVGGEILANGTYELRYDSAYNAAAGAWVLLNPTGIASATGALGDPNADRVVFWDDSAGGYAYLTIGAGLAITATTLDASIPAAASQAEQETGSSTTVYVTPGRQHYHQSAAKCWGLTTGGGTPVLSTSYNVTSISDDGTGLLGVTIATDFSSANYAPVSGILMTSAGGPRWSLVNDRAAGTFQISAWNNGASLADPTAGYCWACYGDL